MDSPTLSVFVPAYRELPHNWRDYGDDIWATVQRGDEEQAYRARGWTVCSFGREPGTIRLRKATAEAMEELFYRREVKKRPFSETVAGPEQRIFRVDMPDGSRHLFTD